MFVDITGARACLHKYVNFMKSCLNILLYNLNSATIISFMIQSGKHYTSRYVYMQYNVYDIKILKYVANRKSMIDCSTKHQDLKGATDYPNTGITRNHKSIKAC